MKVEIEAFSRMATEEGSIDLAMGSWENGVLAMSPATVPGWDKLAEYGPTCGMEPFLEAVASYVNCEPDEVLPTTGATAALGLVCVALRRPRVVVTSPAYPGFLHTPMQLGCEVVSLPPSRSGHEFGRVDWDAVRETLRPHDLLVMADPDNPTGRVLRREDYWLGENICSRSGAWFFVDRTYEEFDIDLAPAPLNDIGGTRLIFAGSVSKTLGAALRIGWIITRNKELRRGVEQALKKLFVSVSPVTQLFVASRLKEDRSGLRRLVRENHEQAFRFLTDFGLKPRRSQGGLFICAPAQDPWDCFRVLKDCGLMSVPSDVFQAGCATDFGFLRLCLARKAETLSLAEKNLLGHHQR